MRYRSQALLPVACGLIALAGLVIADRPPTDGSWSAAWADDPGKDDQPPPALPPLSVDKGSLLLLDEGKREISPEDRAAQALNGACFVCHANLQHEPLVATHAAAKVGCRECHGPSLAHCNDEDNITPPDIMFPTTAIDAACRECHPSHDVPAARVIARWQERSHGQAQADAICTNCHGRHRLQRRVVRWDKHTRALIVGAADAAPSKPALGTHERKK